MNIMGCYKLHCIAYSGVPNKRAAHLLVLDIIFDAIESLATAPASHKHSLMSLNLLVCVRSMQSFPTP